MNPNLLGSSNSDANETQNIMNVDKSNAETQQITNTAKSKDENKAIQTLKFPPVGFKECFPSINALIKRNNFFYQYKWDSKVVVLPSPLIEITLVEETISSLHVTSSVNETIMDFAV